MTVLMNKIYRKEITLELTELFENSIGISFPYYVSRVEKDDEVIWFGLETNWKLVNNQWYCLVKSDFVKCEEPEYEKLFKKLNYES
jgi:hypothetical protein